MKRLVTIILIAALAFPAVAFGQTGTAVVVADELCITGPFADVYNDADVLVRVQSINALDDPFFSVDHDPESSIPSDQVIAVSDPVRVEKRWHAHRGCGVEVQMSEPVVERREDGRGVEVRVESVIIANINGGGPVIKLKTLNGNINIRNSDN